MALKRERFLTGEEFHRLGQVLNEIEADASEPRPALTPLNLGDAHFTATRPPAASPCLRTRRAERLCRPGDGRAPEGGVARAVHPPSGACP